MLLKCLTILLTLTVIAVQSYPEGRNIPVEIRYEKEEKHLAVPEIKKEETVPAHEENQLKTTETEVVVPKERLILEAEDTHLPAVRNLDEKVQLAPVELSQALKHIPVSEDIEIPEHTNVQEEENVQLKKLGDVQTSLNQIQVTNNRVELIQQVEQFITNGVNTIRSTFTIENPSAAVPGIETWQKLERDLTEYFSEEKNKLSLKQDQPPAQQGSQQNIFQNLANGIQSISNNFIQSLQGGGGNATQDEQQPPWQGFVGYFQGGVQNLLNTVNNVGGQAANSNSTVLGDSSSNQPGNIFSNIFNNVQQLFQGPNQGNNQGIAANGTQSDTGTNPNPPQQGPGSFFSGAINQFNQVVSNIIPGSQSQAQVPVQGDEGVPANGTNPVGGIQQVIQSFGSTIGNAFNQITGGGNRPQGSEDENNQQQPPNQNFIQSIGQNIGNAFQNIQNAIGGTQNPISSGTGGSNNPANAIVGQVQNAGTQLQQLAGQQSGSNPIQNVIPGGGSKNPAETAQPSTATEEDATTIQPAAEEGKTLLQVQTSVDHHLLEINNEEKQQVSDKDLKLSEKNEELKKEKPATLEKTIKDQPQADEKTEEKADLSKPKDDKEQLTEESVPVKHADEIMMAAE